MIGDEHRGRLGDVVGIQASIARYSRLYLGDDLLRFIVMIHAVWPSITTVFSCVYVNVGLDHTTATPPACS